MLPKHSGTGTQCPKVRDSDSERGLRTTPDLFVYVCSCVEKKNDGYIKEIRINCSGVCRPHNLRMSDGSIWLAHRQRDASA